MVRKTKFDYGKAGFIIAVLSLLFAVLSLQSDWTIAIKSGSLKQSDISLGLLGLPIEPSSYTKIVFGHPKVSGDKDPVIGTLPISIANAAQRTVDNTTITFRFHKILQRDLLERLEFVPSGNIQATKIQRSFSEIGVLHYSSYNVPEINPGDTLLLEEPLFLPFTTLDVPVDAVTADKVPINVMLNVKYAYTFDLTLAARDLMNRDYHFSFETVEVNSLDELSQSVLSEKISTFRKEARLKANFAQYLRSLVFGTEPVCIYLIFVQLEEHKVANGSLWFKRSTPRVRRACFTPTSWSYLF